MLLYLYFFFTNFNDVALVILKTFVKYIIDYWSSDEVLGMFVLMCFSTGKETKPARGSTTTSSRARSNRGRASVRKKKEPPKPYVKVAPFDWKTDPRFEEFRRYWYYRHNPEPGRGFDFYSFVVMSFWFIYILREELDIPEEEEVNESASSSSSSSSEKKEEEEPMPKKFYDL